ncbi:Emopamil-binding protein [Aspergillus desertorum]
MDGPLSHPYYPVDARIIDYTPNRTSVHSLISTASLSCAVLLGATLLLTTWARPNLRMADRIAILWFVLSGALHCFFEGYFIINHGRMGSAQDFFGQLWKEYALSDSRYLTSDTLVLCMETITVLLWGPLCFGVAYLIFSNHSMRHSLQIIVCMAHLYGDTLYFATSIYDDHVRERPYCRPEPFYFWVYYVGMNFIWIVVPAVYLYHSIKAISHAMEEADKASQSRKSE